MATWQHLRSSTANKRPTTSLADGRIAINTNTASPGLFFKDSAGTGIVKVGPVHVGTTAPNSSPAVGGSSGNYLGEQWLDTSVSPAQLKVWNGTTWVGVVADELPVSKLQDGAARQLIQTDAAGTGVEWTSNVDVPGTLDVTSTATFDSIAQHPLGNAAAPTITFTGDTNTGIYSPGADQLALSTNGTGRLFVGSTGNTEIISSGSIPLQVSASLPRIRSNDSDGTNLTADFYTSNGTAFIDSRNDTVNGAIVLRGLGGGVASEYMRITSAGLVGIGTSAPGALLECASSATNGPVVRLHNSATSIAQDTEYGRLEWYSSDTSTGGTGISNYIGAYAINAGVRSALTFGVRHDSGVFEAMRLDNLGRLGIGTTSPTESLFVSGNIGLTGSSPNKIYTNANELYLGADEDNNNSSSVITFNVDASERARIDSSGRLLVGTSSAYGTNAIGSAITSSNQVAGISIAAASTLNTYWANNVTGSAVNQLAKSRGALGTHTIVQSGDRIGAYSFAGSDGSSFIESARIEAFVDGTPGANDMPGRLVFSTTPDGASSPTERLSIDSSGYIFPDVSSRNNVASVQGTGGGGLKVISGSSDVTSRLECFSNSTSTRYGIIFSNPNGIVGSITTAASATAYNTSSDYRLKENVTPVTDGITRLQQLKPSRFNFIADPSKTVDGFIAHEAQAVVPECVTGEKDAVDADGKPVYQGIDQSKLVPLLTAALQEAVAKIESLEARLTAAGI